MDNNWNHDYVQIARDSGFKLKQIKEGELDWRLLGSVDIETLVRTQHLQRLDTLIDHVAEAPLAKILDSNVLDSGVVKYFHLAQLSVQYLLFCKRFLDETLAGVRKSLQTLRTENIQLKTLNKESNDELLKLHKKLQKIEDINQIVFPCSLCPKNFVTNEMLDTHIKRKHSTNAGKATVENDINLINTIKLELEIKHLKERLNIAEREIRDKQNSCRKDAGESEKIKIVNSNSREVNTEREYATVATQTNNSTRSVGIQNNLEERKELDESDGVGKSMQQEIVTELRDKLAILEEWKKREAAENERCIAIIQNKVDEMLTTVDHKLTQIQATERTTDTAQPSVTQDDIKEMQKVFSDNLGKISRENELKLTSTIRTFENGYRSKLENLENLIARYEESLLHVGEKAKDNEPSSGPKVEQNESSATLSHHLKKNVEAAIQEVKKAPENLKTPNLRYVKQVEELKRFADTETDSELSEAEAISVIPQKPEIRTVQRNIIISSSESEDSGDDKSEVVTVCEKVTRSEMSRPKTARKPMRKPIQENEIVERAKPTLESVRSSAVKLFHKRLKLFGINSNTKAMSKQAKDDISEMLVERRNVFRKKHPNYFAIRNKLKQTIEKKAKERMQPMQINKSQTPFPQGIQEIEENTQPGSAGLRTIVADVESVDSSESENEPVDRNITSRNEIEVTTSNQSPSIDQTKDRDEFKARLERILSSPIRKPVIQMRAPTSIRVETPTTNESPPDSGHKKPIPTPRKKVMFDVNSSDSGTSVPGNQDRLLSSRKQPRNSEDGSGSDHPPVGIIKKTSSESSSISSLLK